MIVSEVLDNWEIIVAVLGGTGLFPLAKGLRWATRVLRVLPVVLKIGKEVLRELEDVVEVVEEGLEEVHMTWAEDNFEDIGFRDGY